MKTTKTPAFIPASQIQGIPAGYPKVQKTKFYWTC